MKKLTFLLCFLFTGGLFAQRPIYAPVVTTTVMPDPATNRILPWKPEGYTDDEVVAFLLSDHPLANNWLKEAFKLVTEKMAAKGHTFPVPLGKGDVDWLIKKVTNRQYVKVDVDQNSRRSSRCVDCIEFFTDDDIEGYMEVFEYENVRFPFYRPECINIIKGRFIESVPQRDPRITSTQTTPEVIHVPDGPSLELDRPEPPANNWGGGEVGGEINRDESSVAGSGFSNSGNWNNLTINVYPAAPAQAPAQYASFDDEEYRYDDDDDYERRPRGHKKVYYKERRGSAVGPAVGAGLLTLLGVYAATRNQSNYCGPITGYQNNYGSLPQGFNYGGRAFRLGYNGQLVMGGPNSGN